MFGAIVAGRLVQTNLQQIDDTHFVFHLEQPYEMNHLTVFLLGTIPFPDGYGASVHFAWPGSDYIPLGVLKSHLPPNASTPGPANLGIEISPLTALEGLQAGLSENNEKGKAVAAKVEVGKVAEKVVKNLFNYLHSFGEVKLTPETPIPLSVFQRWYDNFTRKIENDKGASFLDRAD